MKKIVFILMAVLLAASAAQAKKKDRSGSIRFEEKSFDFGIIREDGGSVSHDFIFTNVGDGNLAVIDANAQCGCTTPEYPEAPVAPGKQGRIRVTYDPRHRPGSFEKAVTVYTKGSPSKAVIKIKGRVIPAGQK